MKPTTFKVKTFHRKIKVRAEVERLEEAVLSEFWQFNFLPQMEKLKQFKEFRTSDCWNGFCS